MKSQWIIVCGLGLALLTAVVAVFNVTPVPLDYILGEVQVSLIIVMSTCILIGGFIVTLFGMYKPYKLQKENEKLDSLNHELSNENVDLKEKLAEAQSAYSMIKKENHQEANKNNERQVNGESESTHFSDEVK